MLCQPKIILTCTLSEKETNDESSETTRLSATPALSEAGLKKLNTDRSSWSSPASSTPNLTLSWLSSVLRNWYSETNNTIMVWCLCYGSTDFVIQTRTIEGMEMAAEMALLMVWWVIMEFLLCIGPRHTTMWLFTCSSAILWLKYI